MFVNYLIMILFVSFMHKTVLKFKSTITTGLEYANMSTSLAGFVGLFHVVVTK